MAKTGLVLCSTSLADVDQLGRRQPDWILVSEEHKTIAIVDLCRPSDVHQAHLLAAAIRKQQKCQPLLEGRSYYCAYLSVGGGDPEMIDSSHVNSLLKFLDIEMKHW